MNVLGKFPRKFLDAPKALIKELLGWPLLPVGSPTNARHPANKGYVDLNSPLPYRYKGSSAPVYMSSSTFSVAHLADRDSTNVVDIRKSMSTTVDIATTGLNGIAQSANLTGTISVTLGSAAITFSTSQDGILQVGDVVTTAGGQGRRLASGSGTSWTAESTFGTTESAVTFKRGGRAPNTFYNLYSIAQAGGINPGLILSTRNVAGGDTLVDLPSGYTFITQQAFAVPTDSSSNMVRFFVSKGWPSRPAIFYRANFTSSAASNQTNVFNGTATTTNVDLSSFVPAISREVQLFQYMASASGSASIRPAGDSSAVYEAVTQSASNGLKTLERDVVMPLDSARKIDVVITGASVTSVVAVHGFVVTEVA